MTKLVILPGLLAIGLVLAHCGKTADEPADAGTTPEAAPSTHPDGATDSGIAIPPLDARDPALDAAPDAHLACTAGDASACDTIPPSTCVDGQVVYFSNGSCVNDTCAWKATAMACGSQSYCLDGGCTPPTTK